MRDIKFRAWDTERKEMWTNPHFALTQMLEVQTNYQTRRSNKYIFMQYTGIKDKNGVEIYERDIITFKDYTDLIVAEVIWNLGGQWDYRPKGWRVGYHASMIGCDIEVIGNDLENPELLRYVKNEHKF